MTDLITQSLPCKLTSEERIDRASRAHIATLESQRIEDSARAAAKSARAAAQHQRDKALELQAAAHAGIEYRDVECREVPHGTSTVIEIVRIDTLETVRTRPMTDKERQEQLFAKKAGESEARASSEAEKQEEPVAEPGVCTCNTASNVHALDCGFDAEAEADPTPAPPPSKKRRSRK